ncbi:TXNRD1 [Bugula neritina]|uniref:TXNRD1 n=1 Tax=Bugula neritina TaxID=10212 RepID=A0A7J7IZN3_BUGNE|nr:TXNRD1 [Bugula neritina]
MMFSKSYCPFCTALKELFKSLKIEYEALELDLISNGAEIQQVLLNLSSQKTVPNVYIKEKHIGGHDSVVALHRENKLLPMMDTPHNFDYDLIVIGGGSGGLSAAKEAASLGRRVAVCDFVKPSPAGTTWGHHLKDAKSYGWGLEAGDVTHSWAELKEGVQNHIGSINWGYRVQLRENNIKYLNAYAQFIGPNTVKCGGFLAGVGLDVTIMVRSILLRGFDQYCADLIGKYMENNGVKFIKGSVPTKIEKLKDGTDSEPGLYRVTAKDSEGKEVVEEYNTVSILSLGSLYCLIVQ